MWRRSDPVAPGQRPDLVQRIRLLLALHPALGREPYDLTFLPVVVAEWIRWVADLPEGTRFAGLLEALRAHDPAAAEGLQALALRDRGLIGDLEPEDARQELQGACAQLRQQSVRSEIDRLAATGLQDAASRTRYAELQQWLRPARSG